MLSIIDPFHAWDLISEDFKSYLPVPNLQLPSKTGSVSIIQTLPVELVRGGSAYRNNGFDKLPMNWHRLPHVTLFVIKSDDIDHYKNNVKPAIRKVFTSWNREEKVGKLFKRVEEKERKITDGDDTQVLFLYLATGGKTESVSTSWLTQQRNKPSVNYKKVFDRLRSDFPRDECVRLDVFDTTSQTGVTQWEELQHKLRGCLVASFQSRCNRFEAEITRRAKTQNLPLWNFCHFFLVKEAYALHYQTFQLYEEALRLYSELAALFDASSIHRILNPSEEDQTSMPPPLLDLAKPAVDMNIHHNSVSEHHFRCYMFSRHVHLLLALQRPYELLIEGKAFFTSLLSLFKTARDDNGRPRFRIPVGEQCTWCLGAILDMCSAARQCFTRIQTAEYEELLLELAQNEGESPYKLNAEAVQRLTKDRHTKLLKQKKTQRVAQKRLMASECDLLLFIQNEIKCYLETNNILHFDIPSPHLSPSFSSSSSSPSSSTITEFALRPILDPTKTAVQHPNYLSPAQRSSLISRALALPSDPSDSSDPSGSCEPNPQSQPRQHNVPPENETTTTTVTRTESSSVLGVDLFMELCVVIARVATQAGRERIVVRVKWLHGQLLLQRGMYTEALEMFWTLEFRQAWAALIPPQPLQQDLIHTIHTHLRSRRVLREEDPVELTSPESLFKVKPNVRVKEREYVDHALDLNELIKVQSGTVWCFLHALPFRCDVTLELHSFLPEPFTVSEYGLEITLSIPCSINTDNNTLNNNNNNVIFPNLCFRVTNLTLTPGVNHLHLQNIPNPHHPHNLHNPVHGHHDDPDDLGHSGSGSGNETNVGSKTSKPQTTAGSETRQTGPTGRHGPYEQLWLTLQSGIGETETDLRTAGGFRECRGFRGEVKSCYARLDHVVLYMSDLFALNQRLDLSESSFLSTEPTRGIGRGIGVFTAPYALSLGPARVLQSASLRDRRTQSSESLEERAGQASEEAEAVTGASQGQGQGQGETEEDLEDMDLEDPIESTEAEPRVTELSSHARHGDHTAVVSPLRLGPSDDSVLRVQLEAPPASTLLLGHVGSAPARVSIRVGQQDITECELTISSPSGLCLSHTTHVIAQSSPNSSSDSDSRTKQQESKSQDCDHVIPAEIGSGTSEVILVLGDLLAHSVVVIEVFASLPAAEMKSSSTSASSSTSSGNGNGQVNESDIMIIPPLEPELHHLLATLSCRGRLSSSHTNNHHTTKAVELKHKSTTTATSSSMGSGEDSLSRLNTSKPPHNHNNPISSQAHSQAFLVRKELPLTFKPPVVFKASVSRLGSRYFLQVCLKPTIFSLKLTDFRLRLPSSFQLVYDANAMAREQVLARKRPFTLVFELEEQTQAVVTQTDETDHSPKEGKERDIRGIRDTRDVSVETGWFALTGVVSKRRQAVEGSDFEVRWPLDVGLMCRKQQLLQLALSFPPHALIGKFITMTVMVTNIQATATTQHSPQTKPFPASTAASTTSPGESAGSVDMGTSRQAQALSLQYELQADPNLWMMSGKKKAIFQLSPAEKITFSVKLLPIASGYLPIPRIKLLQSKSEQLQQNEEKTNLQATAVQISESFDKPDSRGGVITTETKSSVSDYNSEGLKTSTETRDISDDQLTQNSPSESKQYCQIDPSQILYHYASQAIYVYPPGSLRTGCELIAYNKQ